MEMNVRARVNLQLNKAKQKLQHARKIYGVGLYEDAISRAYYAMFHGAKALLMIKHVTPKTHAGVIAKLGEHFIKTKELDPIFAKMLAYAKELREYGDYATGEEAGEEEAKVVLGDAEKFIREVEKLIAPVMREEQ